MARNNAGNCPRVTFLGYGEAARAFVQGWSATGMPDVSAYDIKTETPGSVRNGKHADYRADGIRGCEELREAISTCDVVFSMVTADQSLDAAEAAASSGIESRLFLDCNSSAPQTKQASCDAIEAAGGRYMDVAVMTPVHPALHRTSVLTSGAHADEAARTMKRLDMNVSVVEGPVGRASAIKLVRSIAVKGIEALSAEMLVAGRKLGVTDEVLSSLDATHPGFRWAERGAYALDRMMIHGERRGAEMEEAAKMVASLNLPATMSEAAARWQALVGGMALDPGEPDADRRADLVIAALDPD
ncbi:MAG: NAD(P)-dependent oxidoreductase [Boseongicola sp. SB0670_bin_30]|nr:NAD(P)-dependent oxidoreductase [Boseongicola sp. SB0670_bin_30]